MSTSNFKIWNADHPAPIFRKTAVSVFFEAEGFEGATGEVDSVRGQMAGEIVRDFNGQKHGLPSSILNGEDHVRPASGARITAESLEEGTPDDAFGGIKPEESGGWGAHRSERLNHGGCKAEVHPPQIGSRIVKTHY
jgi:hypothetical protein